MTFSKEEKEFLLYMFEHKLTPKPFNKIVAKHLIGSGMLRLDRPEFTNRGIIHLMVECNVSFLEVRKAFPQNMKSEDEELSILQKAFDGNEEWINIFYYFKFKQYIEWDLFEANSDARHMNNEELKRFQLRMMENLIEDGRVPIEKVLKMYGVPEGMITGLGLNKETMKAVFEQIKKYL